MAMNGDDFTRDSTERSLKLLASTCRDLPAATSPLMLRSGVTS